MRKTSKARHLHVMREWGSDPRFSRCTIDGCEYVEMVGQPGSTRQPSLQATQGGMFEDVWGNGVKSALTATQEAHNGQ